MTLYPVESFKTHKIKKTTWDIETDSPKDKSKVVLIGFFNGSKYFLFDNFDAFIGECLKSKYYGYSHFAHFGGKFDFLFLLDALKKYNFEYDIIEVNGRILEIKVIFDKYKGKHISFKDSFSLMSKSLKDITESFKDDIKHVKKHQDFKIAYSDMTKEQQEEFKEYTYYDVMGLYESLDVFENIINKYGGSLQLTIASTGLKIFKNKYLKTILNSLNDVKIGTDIFNNDIILEIEKIIREYYFGGRNEIFKRYIENGFYYDVNSLYPFVMLDEMPVSKPLFLNSDSIDFKKDKGFVYCDNIEYWNTKKIPIIPYKLQLKYTSKLVYPIGKWKGWLDLDLYRKAESLGYKLNPKYGFIFNCENIFKDYILDFYELRSLNDSMKLIAKLLMNSLYGKFAQKRNRKIFVKYLGTDLEILKDLIPYDLDLNLYQKDTESLSKHIIPSISAHITTLAQLKLYEYIEKVGNDNVYYVDTDSIITTEQLKTSKKLGDVKLEYEIDEAVFLLPKTYCLNGFDVGKNEHVEKVVMKGYTKTDFNFNDFMNVLKDSKNLSKFSYTENRLYGFKESIKRHGTFVTFGEKKKSIKSNYDKRIIAKDGINTNPLIINDGIIINH